MSEATEQGQQAWIIVADRENMARVAKHNVFGLSKKGPLGRVQVGDKVVAYIRGEKVFGGLGEITEPHYLDDEELFNGGLYPERIGVKLNLLPPEQGKDVWHFLDDLTFPSDKARWSASLVGGIKRIPMADYNLFEAGLKT